MLRRTGVAGALRTCPIDCNNELEEKSDKRITYASEDPARLSQEADNKPRHSQVNELAEVANPLICPPYALSSHPHGIFVVATKTARRR